MEWMCTGRELQVDDAETEKAWEEKLLVTPVIPARRLVSFLLVDRKDRDGR